MAFVPITKDQLRDLATVAQCLDNQWVPTTLLHVMTRRGQSLQDVQSTRDAAVRAEYLRSLINSEQLVVNRVYLYNNTAITQDMTGHGRDALKQLLHSATIVPFLYGEESPVQETGIAKDHAGFQRWCALADEVEMSCVRLSWNDSVNGEEIRKKLALKFHEFVVNLLGRASSGSGDKIFASHLRLPGDRVDAFREHLDTVSTWAFRHGRHGLVTREAFYREFVVAKDSNPTHGRCDPTKPFAAEIKQLIDLQYNTTLPEALDRLPIRPVDSLHRAALQEWNPGRGTVDVLDDDEMLDSLLARLHFDSVMDELETTRLGALELPDVVKLRDTDEWATYVISLKGLVDNPRDFDTWALRVKDSYGDALRRLGRFQQRRETIDRWRSALSVTFDFAGVLVKLTYGRDPVFKVIGSLPANPSPTMGTTRILVQDVVDDTTEAKHQLAADTMFFAVEDPPDKLEHLKSRLVAAGAREVEPNEAELRESRGGGLESDLESG